MARRRDSSEQPDLFSLLDAEGGGEQPGDRSDRDRHLLPPSGVALGVDAGAPSGVYRDRVGPGSAAGWPNWPPRWASTKYVPLCEAKMLSHFDHRFATYRGATQAQLNVGALPRLADAHHDDPNLESPAHYWVDRSEVAARLDGRWDRDWVLGWRRITKAEQMRTFIPTVMPVAAAGDSIFLAFPTNATHGPLLHGAWSSLVFDYVARQKLSGLNMNYFVTKQLACAMPSTFDEATSWQRDLTLADWVRSYDSNCPTRHGD